MRRTLLAWLVILALFAVSYQATYGAQSSYEAAIVDACARHGCDAGYMIALIDCETGGTWDPNSVGPHGERGLLQFHPYGEWPYAAWYGPLEQIELAAQLLAAGRADAWVCP